MEALVVIEGIVILLLSVLVAGLLRSHAEILRKLHALGAGEDVPVPTPAVRRRPPATAGFERAPLTVLDGVTPRGDAISVSLEHGRGPTLLAFLSSGCTSCQTFWTAFSGDFELPEPGTRTVIATKGPADESISEVARLAPESLTTVMSTEAWDAFRVPMTPYFLFVDGSGQVIGEGSASTWRHLLGLLRQSSADLSHAGRTSPVHLDTEGRAHFTDDELTRAGIEPGDPSLYRNPVDGQ